MLFSLCLNQVHKELPYLENSKTQPETNNLIQVHKPNELQPVNSQPSQKFLELLQADLWDYEGIDFYKKDYTRHFLV